jgi:hypothetical protein
LTPSNPYDKFRNYKFSNNYDTKNYGAADDPAKRTVRAYDANKISGDQYGQPYDINKLNLSGFKDQLKKTKK